MKTGWRIVIIGLLCAGGLAAWILWTYQDPLFHMKPLRSRLLDTLPVSGTAHFRNEFIDVSGALCGQVDNVTGGEQIGGPPGSRAIFVPVGLSQWRRYIVIPSVPAFYVEGLPSWSLSLDGKRFKMVSVTEKQQQTELLEQYQLAASYDGIDQTREQREIGIKSMNESFETTWAKQCSQPRR